MTANFFDVVGVPMGWDGVHRGGVETQRNERLAVVSYGFWTRASAGTRPR